MIVSFLISQQNNIVRIRKCIEKVLQGNWRRKNNSFEEGISIIPSQKAEVLASLERR